MVARPSPPLERFGQLQAVLVLLSCPLVALVRHPWPLALAAVIGLSLLLLAQWGRYTSNGSFGSANAVTLLRLVGVLWLAASGHFAPASVVVPVAVGVMLLDGLDGVLARRSGTSSPFGAHFDVEVDALLVMVLGVALWQRERFDAWVVWAGFLRYLYVLAQAVAPAPEPPPRSRLGRFAFGGVFAGLLAAFVEPGDLGTVAAVGGTLLVTASFAHSFYFAYGRRAR